MIQVEAQFDTNISEVTNFLHDNRITHVIGFSGGSEATYGVLPPDHPAVQQYKTYLESMFKEIINTCLEALNGFRVGILTGGTKWGIPKYGLHLAKARNFPTIGVLPSAGKEHSLEDKYFDLKVVVSNSLNPGFWSDEAIIWTNIVDAIVVIGGGSGTLVECAHLMKINEKLVKEWESGDESKRPKPIIPVFGAGGIAEQIQLLCPSPQIREAIFPREKIYNGKGAANYLINNLELKYSV